MCAVSVISDWGRGQNMTQWTSPAWSQFQEVLKKLEELDKKLGLPDCHDPAKAQWMKDVEQRLQLLEGR